MMEDDTGACCLEHTASQHRSEFQWQVRNQYNTRAMCYTGSELMCVQKITSFGLLNKWNSYLYLCLSSSATSFMSLLVQPDKT